MPSLTIASMILWISLVYAAIGIPFAAWFVLAGAARIDPVIRTTSLRTRILFAPGAVALWPLLAPRCLRAGGAGVTKGQRKAHAMLWLLLGPLLLVGVALLLANRPPVAAPSAPTDPGAITP